MVQQEYLSSNFHCKNGNNKKLDFEKKNAQKFCSEKRFSSLC